MVACTITAAHRTRFALTPKAAIALVEVEESDFNHIDPVDFFLLPAKVRAQSIQAESDVLSVFR